MSDNAIELKNLHFSYPRRNIRVLTGVNMAAPRGSIVALMGGSGSGKTTILRLITGQYRASPGSEVIVAGEHVEKLNQNELYRMRRKIGMLFQFSGLFTDLSLADNVAFPLREHTRLSLPIIRDLVLMKLHAVGLRTAAERYPSELSGGQQRRVALARAIALDPQILLYDEPFSGLDPVSRTVIAKLIQDLNYALGVTSVIITHDVPETFQIADLIYLMWQGKVISSGTPAEISASQEPLVNQFVNAKSDGAAAVSHARLEPGGRPAPRRHIAI